MSRWLSIADIAEKVQSGELKATAMVEQAFKSIEQCQKYDAIIATIPERAKRRAQELDGRIALGEQTGRLSGVPFIAKDNFLTFGSETTAASNILRGFEAPYQSTVIERLEAEGAICVAKANLDAFAHGGSTENSDFMVTKNPHDASRVPGGSSGGSAAAVMLDMAPFALGTDTGGSIRLPASFTGAVGLKPTYGLVSRSGVVAMASSTDVVGPLARTVEDAALVLDVISGRDLLDGTTVNRDPEPYTNLDRATVSEFKIGIIKEYMGEGVDHDVREQIQSTVEALQKAGADIQELSLPSLDLALAAYYIIVPAEISSNLSRYDGQRYGFSHPDATNLDQSYNWSRSEGFGREAKRRIMIGTYVLSSGYYDAYYKKAQQLRTKLIEEFNKAFKSVDFLVGPIAPMTAFKIGENTNDPLKMYLADAMTVGVSLAGLPAISVPVGLDRNSLPVGMQLIGQQRTDRKLFSLAKEIERLVK